MQALVKIIQDSKIGPAVSGREVYAIAAHSKSKRDIFSDWFRSYSQKLNLVSGRDYVTSSVILPGASRGALEAILSISAAKRIADIQAAKRGAGIVAYLSEYERTGSIPKAAATEPPILLDSPNLPMSQANGHDEPPEQTQEAATQPLSPIQQLLQQAQQLAEAEARRESEQTKPSEEQIAFEARLSSLEKRVNVVLYFFQQASFAARSLAPATLPLEPEEQPLPETAPAPELVAPPTNRALLVRLVNSYSAADRKSEHDTWKYLYGQFDMRTGFNAYAQTNGRVRDQSYLSVIEERGQIDALYELAKKLLVLPELK